MRFSDERLVRAANAVSVVSEDARVSDDALLVYAAMSLVCDEDGTVNEDRLLEALRDPFVYSMAEGAVRMARYGDVL